MTRRIRFEDQRMADDARRTARRLRKMAKRMERDGIETVQQVMHRVACDYVFSSTGRIVTTDVLRGVAMPPARVPIRGSHEALAAA